MRTLGLRMSARASAMRCFCPPDSSLSVTCAGGSKGPSVPALLPGTAANPCRDHIFSSHVCKGLMCVDPRADAKCSKAVLQHDSSVPAHPPDGAYLLVHGIFQVRVSIGTIRSSR